ncbi:MAG: transcriptional regulator [Nitrosopumilaceae archaeon]|nr:transcriptional regulator [Nitrosopumilaceae archaeon]NIU00469.1 transcriptional regulator [Nitrosopumilaceae archaeon]NIU86852.1 transcriptional regulator [Nitrosopumilaceae archaeon]NIV65533.1 transcriptional regulator [Nitrosopumilaceae archaeon]NIX61071.1 transcriptional regulator [Nitrosopumilaceae archaeon]
MPEIWLNYGMAEVVLDIRAENLEQNVDLEGVILTDSQIEEKLSSLDFSIPIDLVVLHNSRAVQKIISSIFSLCEKKSYPFPNIFAEKHLVNLVKRGMPEGTTISEFNDELSKANLVFLSELELDGLFGYETIATRLLRKFGQDYMLSAYSKRKANTPTPGQITDSIEEARQFSDKFEIQGIEILANSKGIIDIAINHPSKTITLTKSLESIAIRDIGQQKSMIISTGKEASNYSLSKSFSSLWNCSAAIKDNGLAILIAECRGGLGSEALQQYIEGRLGIEKLKNPTKYVEGMENLLYLSETQKRFQVGLISILPEFYTKKLNIIPLNGVKQAMEYILKTQGGRQKVTVVSDGARMLLR